MSEQSGNGAKGPERPPAEIRADIEKERAALGRSFESLRGGLDEAVDDGRRRADEIGRKARVIGPVVAGLAVTVLVARSLIRRRSHEED